MPLESETEAPVWLRIRRSGRFGPERLEEIAADAARSAESRGRVSQHVNNVFFSLDPERVALSARDVAAAAARPDLAPEARDVLEELFVTLFFFRHVRELGGGGLSRPDRVLRAHLSGWRRDRRLGRRLAERHAETLEGGVRFVLGEREAAYRHFDRARRDLLRAGELRHHNRGLLSMRGLETFRGWAREAAPPRPAPRMLEDRPLRDDRPLVFAAMDGVYYARYARRLIETAAGRCNLHLHVVNAGETPLIEAPHARHSVEEAPGAGPHYYATVRFLHARSILERYGRPMLIADADAYFVGEPSRLLQATRDRDVVLNAAPHWRLPRAYRAVVPWRFAMAGLFVAQPTSGAAAYLALFERLHDALVRDDPAGPHWWVDQALLCAAADVAEAEGRGLRIGRRMMFGPSGMKQSKL